MGGSRLRTLFGRFFLEDELGQGAAGVVYRAKDSMLGTTVALKVIHPELVGDREVRERFKREITLSRRVQHPGVCRIYDLHEIDENGATQLALAMELLEGKTLAQEIHDEGKLGVRRTFEILSALVPPLSAAHEAGVIHRDLKPGNVLVTTSGALKLLDFGMATADDVMKVTRPGNTVGSLRFIAPEVWEGEPATAASDLYALGVLLYACLCGRLPYEAKSPGEMFQAIKRPPPTLVGQNVEVTEAIDAVVQKAMARRPNERQRSVRVLLEDFARALEAQNTAVSLDAPPAAASASPPPLPRGPRTPTPSTFTTPAPPAATAAPAGSGARADGTSGRRETSSSSRPRPADGASPGTIPAIRPIPAPLFAAIVAAPLVLALLVAAVAGGDDPGPPQQPRIRDLPKHLASWDLPEEGEALTLVTPTERASGDDGAQDGADHEVANGDGARDGAGRDDGAAREGGRDGTRDGARDNRGARPGSAADLRAQLSATMKKRGIMFADLPDVEALDKKSRQIERSDEKGAREAVQQAKQIVDKTQIDRGFIMSKQKRLTKMLDKASPKTRDKIRPIENDIAKAFAARDYALANLNINRAFLQASR